MLSRQAAIVGWDRVAMLSADTWIILYTTILSNLSKPICIGG